MCNAWNHPPGCTCGFGGEGHLGRPPEPPDGRSYGFPLHTFLTPCWWCGERVHFYRNENGGCALFDELGYPWQIHKCWELHRSQHVEAIRGILTTHKARLLSGGYSFPSTDLVTPLNGEALRLCGHVYKTLDRIDLVQTRHHGDFVRLDILDKDLRIYPVLLLREWYMRLRTSPFLTLECIAWRRGAQLEFFAHELTVTDHRGKCITRTTTINIREVVRDQWSFRTDTDPLLKRNRRKKRKKRK